MMRTAGQGSGRLEKRDGFMRPDQDSVTAGYAGFTRTIEIGAEKQSFFKTCFSSIFSGCLDETEPYSVEQWIEREQRGKRCSFAVYECAGEGGALAALWNLSGIFNAGIGASLRCVSMRQVTVEVYELFELSPYWLYSRSCTVLVPDKGGQLVRRLREGGIPAGVIRSMAEGGTRQICHEQVGTGFLERPQSDELTRVIRDGLEVM